MSKFVLTAKNIKLNQDMQDALSKKGFQSLRRLAFDRKDTLERVIKFNLGLDYHQVCRTEILSIICKDADDFTAERFTDPETGYTLKGSNPMMEAIYQVRDNNIPTQVVQVDENGNILRKINVNFNKKPGAKPINPMIILNRLKMHTLTLNYDLRKLQWDGEYPNYSGWKQIQQLSNAITFKSLKHLNIVIDNWTTTVNKLLWRITLMGATFTLTIHSDKVETFTYDYKLPLETFYSQFEALNVYRYLSTNDEHCYCYRYSKPTLTDETPIEHSTDNISIGDELMNYDPDEDIYDIEIPFSAYFNNPENIEDDEDAIHVKTKKKCDWQSPAQLEVVYPVQTFKLETIPEPKLFDANKRYAPAIIKR